jgi:hypothetical protein
MRRLGCILLLLAAFCARPARAQVQKPEDIVVDLKHSSLIARPGVNAAYSMDTNIVQAEAVPGGVQLTANSPGATTVVLVTASGVQTFGVTVPQPLRERSNGAGGFVFEGQTVEFGQYEFRYNNSPNQVTNLQNVTQVVGNRQIHVQVMNDDIFPASGESPVGFPILSYEISTPGKRLTLMDRMMDNSPLTMSGTMLRGIHLERGPWEYHAGITSVTQFQDFLLPSNRYEVAGVSRRFKLNDHSSLEGNFYYFNTDKSVNTNATPGAIGTLYYQFRRGQDLHARAEIGIGHGVAFAGKLEKDGAKQHAHADFSYQSPQIASLSINQIQGRKANVSWQDRFSKHLQTQFFGSDTDVNLPTEKQLIDTATLNQTFWMTPHIGLVGGATASRFVSTRPVAPTVRGAGFLAGPQLLWKHAGGSFGFQKLQNGGGTPSSTNYQVTAETSVTHANISGYFNVQTETPVFATVQSTQPSLQPVLQRESETALGPAAMAQFMRQTAVLTTQGYMQTLAVEMAAKRAQYGGTIDWTNRKAGHLTLNCLFNTSSGGATSGSATTGGTSSSASAPETRLVSGGVVWTRRFGTRNLVNAGFSIFRSTSGGQSTIEPVEQFSLQHQLNSVPRWMVPGRRGSIAGHVFIDADFAQSFKPGAAALANVLVFLDGRRSTHTDKSGYYIFKGVPWGVHRVEADYRDTRPFYMTSGSPKTVSTGASADFGVSYAKGRIFGKFTNDAGTGLHVEIEIDGAGLHRQESTSGDGILQIGGLPDGTYTVHPMTASLPPGYSVADLADQTIQVTAQQAGRFHFTVVAQRSISGHVRQFDAATGTSTPLDNIEVSLAPLQHATHTDAAGRYLFRQLAAGTYTVTVNYQGKPYTQTVLLTPEPDIESAIDIVIPRAPSRNPTAPGGTEKN